MRLRRERTRGITRIFLQKGTGDFACHRTLGEDDDGETVVTAESQHCAGALIFAEKHEAPTQMMRICERLGLYDASKLKGHHLVFDTAAEMLKTAIR